MSIPSWITPQGNIGAVVENNSFSYSLLFSGSPAPSAEILTGSLPDGLSMDSSGNISGTVSDIAIPNFYNFVVRLTNVNGIADRGFNIQVQDTAPTWSDPTDLGTVGYYSFFEYQFSVTDPGASTNPEFIKIAGELPPGLEFFNTGLVVGFIDFVANDTVYTFTIRYQVDNKILDKTFTIEVVTNLNRPPAWNTPAGLLGVVNFGQSFSYQLSAGDPDLDTITYTGFSVPAGFTVDSAGLVSGSPVNDIPSVSTFTVQATDGNFIVSRQFVLIINQTTVFPVEWITPGGLLGEIGEGNKSLFAVRAQTQDIWLRYEIVSGALPPGLSIDINSGDIWGQVQVDVAATTTYTFEVRAYTQSSEAFETFSIDVLNVLDPGAIQIDVKLFGPDRLAHRDLFASYDISYDQLFRQGDDQFGLIEEPYITLVSNLSSTSTDDIYTNVLEDLRRTYLTLGPIEWAQAVVDGQVVYEVLYRKVLDDQFGTDQIVDFPQHSILVKPAALQNVRNELLNQIGISGVAEQLPLWMTSEQNIGDPQSVLGWIPALVFAHVKPGNGVQLAQKMNGTDISGTRLLNRRVRVDRIVVKPYFDNSFSQAQILFDNIP